jgi:hypothetical protein
VVVVPATTEEETASYAAGAGSAHPTLTVTGALTDTGSETTVRLPWAQIDQLAGARPADFAFGVTLNASDDGDKRSGRAHRFANADSYRLTNGWASFYLDPAQAPAQEEQPDLLPPEVAERLTWGYISVLDGLLLGSVGDGTEAQYIFALDKADGKLRWLYTAEESVWHDAIAAGDGHLRPGRAVLPPSVPALRIEGGGFIATFPAGRREPSPLLTTKAPGSSSASPSRSAWSWARPQRSRSTRSSTSSSN